MRTLITLATVATIATVRNQSRPCGSSVETTAVAISPISQPSQTIQPPKASASAEKTYQQFAVSPPYLALLFSRFGPSNNCKTYKFLKDKE